MGCWDEFLNHWVLPNVGMVHKGDFTVSLFRIETALPKPPIVITGGGMRASEPAHALSVTLPKLANWLITVSYPFPVKCMVVVYVWCASMSYVIVVLYTAAPKRRGTHRPYGGCNYAASIAFHTSNF